MLQQEQRIDIPLDDEGLNEERDERTTDLGYRTLDNFVFTNDGALVRRYGHTAVNTVLLLDQVEGFANLPNVPNGPRRLTTYGNTVLLFDDQFAYSVVSGSEGEKKLKRMGWIPPCSAFREPITAFAQSIDYFDCGWVKATNGHSEGYYVFAYATNTNSTARNIYATVIDAATGAHVFHDYQITNTNAIGGVPRVAVDGENVIVAYRADPGIFSTIVTNTLNIATMEWDASFIFPPSPSWDILGGGTESPRGYFHATYQEISGGTLGPNMVFSRYHAANGVQDGTINVALGSSNEVRLSTAFMPAPIDDAVWCFFSQDIGGGGNVFRLARVNNECTTAYLPPTTITGLTGDNEIMSIGCDSDSGRAICVFGGDEGNTDTNYVGVSDTATTLFSKKTLYNWSQLSRPIYYRDKFYQQYWHTGTELQGTSVLVDMMVNLGANEALNEPRPVARYAPRLLATSPPAWADAGDVRPIPTNLFQVGDYTLCGGVKLGSLDERSFLQRVQFDFGYDNDVALGAELGDYIYLAGGQPTVIDKRRPYDQGFLLYPNAVVYPANAGTLPAASNYSYKVVYSHYAANGDVELSSPAEAGSIATGAGTYNSANIVLNNPYLTSHHDSASSYLPDVYAQVYRTPNNQSTFYLLGSQRVYPNALNTAFIDNGAVTDSLLIAKPLLYTEGGFLDNVSAPSFLHVCAHKNRIFGIGDDRRTIWYSKRYVQSEVPGFNEQLTFSIDDDGQPITALASLDDKLIIFKEGKIYYVTGDGPAPGGVGGTLSEPVEFNRQIGCSNPRSVVVCPDGVFFQAPDTRIYLLTRGLEVAPVGKKVQQQTNTYSICTAAFVDDTQQHVRFMLSDGEGGTNGVELCYDYERKKWSRFTFNGTTAFIGAAHANGVNYKLTANGLLYYEDKTRPFNDNNVAINATAERSWFKPSGPQGVSRMARVGLLYERLSNDVTINVSLANGYNSAYHQNTNWSTAQLNTLGASSFHLQVIPTRQESASFSVKIRETDETVSTAGRGVSLTGLSFTFGVDRDQVRVPNGAQK